MKERLRRAVAREELRPLDLHLALFLERLVGSAAPEQLLAVALTSRALGQGHVCLPLAEVAGRVVFTGEPDYLAPSLTAWLPLLASWPVLGAPGSEQPLILDDQHRLYLARYFAYEHLIAQRLRQRAEKWEEVNGEHARPLLAELFPASAPGDAQHLAAALSLSKRLVIIAGGPGTGKTHAVGKILALLQAISPQPLRIELAAPTGKAAARLSEAIRAVRGTLPPQFQLLVPDKARTLHRLLGLVPGTLGYRYHAENPLPLDLLVVDEASMIDIPLMAALLEALPPYTRLIVLGDRDQLASVEAGNFFADLCGPPARGWSAALCGHLTQLTGAPLEAAAPAAPAFGDCVIRLGKNYRFAAGSGIAALAAAINSGQPRKVEEVLQQAYDDVSYAHLAETELATWLAAQVLSNFGPCLRATGASAALQGYNNFRLLCALREGPAGVSGLNRLVERILQGAQLIEPGKRWYKGQPIMIQQNHYGLQLFNGDTGILWPDENNALLAWFARPDGSLFPVTPARLPPHETAYAITIHKAQGSEFARVLLLLPVQETPLLSRELLYTGVTRARQQLLLAGDTQLLLRAVTRRQARYSGLAEKLWRGA